MKLSKPQAEVLCALLKGCTLKSHRYLDGTKVYKLHPLDGPAETVPRTIIDSLKRHRLIHSNQKFPAATYLLTEKGQELATTLAESTGLPLAARNHFHQT